MTPFEYILPLGSVIVGLAVADLAVSLHRLLRARRRVRWDWLPLDLESLEGPDEAAPSLTPRRARS